MLAVYGYNVEDVAMIDWVAKNSLACKMINTNGSYCAIEGRTTWSTQHY